MPRATQIQIVLEETVTGVLDAALPRLQGEIVSRAAEELMSLEPAPGDTLSDRLHAAVAAIQESNSQAEILRHLLEESARFCGRCALFVVKGSSVNGWLGTGFENNDAIKTVQVNAANGLAAAAIQERGPATGPMEDFDASLAVAVDAPAGGTCAILPLCVKEKVAALIYADEGNDPDRAPDMSALSLLCRVAALWLELSALRKAGVGQGATEEPQVSAPPPPAPPAPMAQAAPVEAAPVEEDENQKKARRFAKLLVDEIKLYNQNKVAEGKQNRDLYERLKEDIEKSRATYEKRYGETPAAASNYFNQELVRILADNDIALMGGGFPH